MISLLLYILIPHTLSTNPIRIKTHYKEPETSLSNSDFVAESFLRKDVLGAAASYFSSNVNLIFSLIDNLYLKPNCTLLTESYVTADGVLYHLCKKPQIPQSLGNHESRYCGPIGPISNDHIHPYQYCDSDGTNCEIPTVLNNSISVPLPLTYGQAETDLSIYFDTITNDSDPRCLNVATASPVGSIFTENTIFSNAENGKFVDFSKEFSQGFYSGTCERDKYTKRPIAAWILVCRQVARNTYDWKSLTSLMMREFMKILAIDVHNWPYWNQIFTIDERLAIIQESTDNFLTRFLFNSPASAISSPKTTQKFNNFPTDHVDFNLSRLFSTDPNSVFIYLSTPSVLKVAKSFFNCPNSIGIPLFTTKNILNILKIDKYDFLKMNFTASSESSPIYYSPFFHPLILRNDVLSPIAVDIGTSAYLSQFDWAILKDTGWYEVVGEDFFKQTETFNNFWGNDLGCNFNIIKDLDPFCPLQEQNATNTSIPKGVSCDSTEYTNLFNTISSTLTNASAIDHLIASSTCTRNGKSKGYCSSSRDLAVADLISSGSYSTKCPFWIPLADYIGDCENVGTAVVSTVDYIGNDAVCSNFNNVATCLKFRCQSPTRLELLSSDFWWFCDANHLRVKVAKNFKLECVDEDEMCIVGDVCNNGALFYTTSSTTTSSTGICKCPPGFITWDCSLVDNEEMRKTVLNRLKYPSVYYKSIPGEPFYTAYSGSLFKSYPLRPSVNGASFANGVDFLSGSLAATTSATTVETIHGEAVPLEVNGYSLLTKYGIPYGCLSETITDSSTTPNIIRSVGSLGEDRQVIFFDVIGSNLKPITTKCAQYANVFDPPSITGAPINTEEYDSIVNSADFAKYFTFEVGQFELYLWLNVSVAMSDYKGLIDKYNLVSKATSFGDYTSFRNVSNWNFWENFVELVKFTLVVDGCRIGSELSKQSAVACAIQIKQINQFNGYVSIVFFGGINELIRGSESLKNSVLFSRLSQGQRVILSNKEYGAVLLSDPENLGISFQRRVPLTTRPATPFIADDSLLLQYIGIGSLIFLGVASLLLFYYIWRKRRQQKLYAKSRVKLLQSVAIMAVGGPEKAFVEIEGMDEGDHGDEDENAADEFEDRLGTRNKMKFGLYDEDEDDLPLDQQLVDFADNADAGDSEDELNSDDSEFYNDEIDSEYEYYYGTDRRSSLKEIGSINEDAPVAGQAFPEGFLSDEGEETDATGGGLVGGPVVNGDDENLSSGYESGYMYDDSEEGFMDEDDDGYGEGSQGSSWETGSTRRGF